MISHTTSSNNATITTTSLGGSQPHDGSSGGMKFMAPKHAGTNGDSVADHNDWLSHHPHNDSGSAPGWTGPHDWTPPTGSGVAYNGASTDATGSGHTWTDHNASTTGSAIASPQS